MFQYQWHSQPITYDVMLVLLSFILAWGEAWFFDFRMVMITPFLLFWLVSHFQQIPLETKAKEIWGAAPQRRDYLEDERTPLLAGGGEGGMLARYLIWLKEYRKITRRGVKISLSPKESFLVSIFCRYVEGSTLYEGSVRNFYSPFESPEASDDDEEVGKLVCHV